VFERLDMERLTDDYRRAELPTRSKGADISVLGGHPRRRVKGEIGRAALLQ
jgi:hypothetical protein